MGDAGEVIDDTIIAADPHVYGVRDSKKRLVKNLSMMKSFWSKMTGQCVVRFKVLYRDSFDIRQIDANAELLPTAEDVSDADAFSEAPCANLHAFSNYYGDIDRAKKNLFGLLRQCMITRDLLNQPPNRLCSSLRPLHREI